MHTNEITKDEAAVWFAREELSFMIAATERTLKEIDPGKYYTRTGRSVEYANAILARLRIASGEDGQAPSYQPGSRARGVTFDPRAPTSEHVIMRVEVVAGDKSLVALSDHELSFLNNAINEAVHGLRGIEEFERATGKTRDYGDALMDQLVEAKDKIDALN